MSGTDVCACSASASTGTPRHTLEMARYYGASELAPSSILSDCAVQMRRGRALAAASPHAALVAERVAFDPALGVRCCTRSQRDARVSALGRPQRRAQLGELPPAAFCIAAQARISRSESRVARAVRRLAWTTDCRRTTEAERRCRRPRPQRVHRVRRRRWTRSSDRRLECSRRLGASV
jgi:hypothetical protein